MGFLVGAGESGIPWVAVIGLVAGGAITAPIAARLAHRAPRTLLGVMVGTMVLISNWAIIAKLFGVPGLIAASVVGLLIVAGTSIAVTAHRREMAGRITQADTEIPADLEESAAR